MVSFRSKASPLRACGTRRTNLYPAGFNPFQNPSCALRGRGLQGGWDLSLPRHLSALALSDSGVLNAITQLILLNSIANRHRTVSPCVAAGRLVTVRTVIRLSYVPWWWGYT